MAFLRPHLAAAAVVAAIPAAAQQPISAPITRIQYDITFDSSTATSRTIKVRMAFDVTGPGRVLLALPVWTPGAYEVSNFAKWVSAFAVKGGGKELRWDKLDYTTWRVEPAGARSIEVSFDYLADSLDNAMAWTRPDFALFNGTNLLLYPAGRSLNFPATLRLHTQPGWLVGTGMHRSSEPDSYAEKNYHDLVDMPFFIGRFDYDSTQVAGRWIRLASYPTGILTGDTRAGVWRDIERMIPAESGVFQDTPWDNYTTMMIFDSSYGGGSALEHQSSHVGVYTTGLLANPELAAITAHEMFHSWNVKRLRPADMVPYRYDGAEPTPWLWVSEGITDYYADLTLVRGGIADSAVFLDRTGGKISEVQNATPVALEDASLSTWIHPTDGTGYLYYPKGSLAGFMLDIMIRDASDNRQSLDEVMRGLYRTTYKAGRGFTGVDWWSAIRRAARGKSFTEFNAEYVDGRDPYPWEQLLPLAGLRLVTDTIRQARLGLSTDPGPDSGTVRVTQVIAGGAAAEAGVQVGDLLLSIGDVQIREVNFGPAFRARYSSHEGEELPIIVRRGTETVTLPGRVRLVPEVQKHLELDPGANEKAVRIRSGILHGTVDR